jgi:hypothetical protein
MVYHTFKSVKKVLKKIRNLNFEYFQVNINIVNIYKVKCYKSTNELKQKILLIELN